MAVSLPAGPRYIVARSNFPLPPLSEQLLKRPTGAAVNSWGTLTSSMNPWPTSPPFLLGFPLIFFSIRKGGCLCKAVTPLILSGKSLVLTFGVKKKWLAVSKCLKPTGECVYRNLSGFRLFGGMSRLFPQKSIAIVARKRFGENRIRHKVFGKGNPGKFKFLVLRNAGSDFGKAHFRDALMTSLVEHWDLEKQAYRPAPCLHQRDLLGHLQYPRKNQPAILSNPIVNLIKTASTWSSTKWILNGVPVCIT